MNFKRLDSGVEEATGPAGRDLAHGLFDEIAVHTLRRGTQVLVHFVVGHILFGVSRRRHEFVKSVTGLLGSELLVE